MKDAGATAPRSEPTIRPLAESGLLVELGEGIDPALVERVAALTAAIDAAALPGLIDVVPSYRTILLWFDPTKTDGEALAAVVRRLNEEARGAALAAGREVEIAVAYGGEEGPDLAAVAAQTGLDPAAVATRHAAGAYRVACMGFAPGFAFLVGLPPELATPRRETPRVRVPTGSVGIGGEQTGVYPFPTPGGWNLIGRTAARLFDLEREEPFLLRPGDRVRFRAASDAALVAGDEFDEAASASQSLDAGQTGRVEPLPSARALDSSAAGGRRSREETKGDSHAITVVAPGLATTVQDLGRPGLMRFGVAPGGALDRTALILGNRLLGNPPAAAALEVTLVGPRLRFERSAVIAITGADLGARLNGAACPAWEPVTVEAGDELVWEPAAESGRGRGARAYLCVAGGVAVAPTMGSRSTDLFAGFGGIEGRALRAGDELPIGEPSLPAAAIRRRRLAAPPPVHDPAAPVRVVLGPQAERFTADGIATFLAEAYAVSGKADRTGLRLEGPPIALTAGADLVSEGIAHGAIQVPGDGRPIVLLAARQTIGGYPKIATVIGADLDGLGQRRPGSSIRFAAVEVAVARELTREALAAAELPIVDAPRGISGWSVANAGAGSHEGEDVGMADGGGGRGGAAADWTPESIVRLATALEGSGLSFLKLEIAGAGIALELRWGTAEPFPVAPESAAARSDAGGEGAGGDDDGGTVVTAPLLGVFYRRPGPDEPPFAEPGGALAAGDVLGLIEVMKTYHEVTAPTAGVLAEFLVEDGTFVEFGQGVARLHPKDGS